MEQLLRDFLLFLFSFLPAFLFRPFQRRRYAWCFVLCSLLGAFSLQPFPRFALPIYALLLGLCLFFVLYKPLKLGKLSGLLLCWGSGIAVLNTGHLLRSVTLSNVTAWLLLLFSLLVALALGFASHWLSQWMTEDAICLSEDHSVSPLPLLITISVLLWILTLCGEAFPIGCIFLALALVCLLLMLLSLWDNMALSVRHSKQSSEESRKSVHLIDHASRSSEATLQRRLTESNNKLYQVSLAYQNGDKAALCALLELSDGPNNSYCSYLQLDAILHHRARKAREAGLFPNFQLQLGSMQNFFLPDIGVLVNLMLDLMTERHPGKPDTLRLRMQEWGDALVVVVGRRDSLNTVPENMMNTLLQLTEEYHGWLELAEKERGIRLSAVLFRPTGEK